MGLGLKSIKRFMPSSAKNARLKEGDLRPLFDLCDVGQYSFLDITVKFSDKKYAQCL